jgi:hypothetical protein
MFALFDVGVDCAKGDDRSVFAVRTMLFHLQSTNPRNIVNTVAYLGGAPGLEPPPLWVVENFFYSSCIGNDIYIYIYLYIIYIGYIYL